MKCPGCTHVNAPDARFCIQCGRMLGGACPGCGAVNPAQGRFCSQCGAALEAGPFAEAAQHPPVCQPEERRAFPRHVAGERKHVTVLFSDMSGYTAITQRLDPEEVRDIMARLTHEITRVVARYEGFIEKFAGDAVMAVFGAIQAHEDDAIRAIIAAREIHERVAAYGRRYEEEIGQPLAMHSGINTGLVVTGDVDFEAGTHGSAGAPLRYRRPFLPKNRSANRAVCSLGSRRPGPDSPQRLQHLPLPRRRLQPFQGIPCSSG